MKKILFIVIVSVLLIQSVAASPTYILNDSTLPPEFEAIYDVHKGSMRVGKMDVSLKKVNGELIYESITKPVGMAALFLGDQIVTDRAVLKLINNQYHTIEFKHEMKNSDKNRNEHYIFDWDNKRAVVKYKDRKNEIELQDYTFDNYSAQLLLMRKPDQEKVTNLYSVISKGKLKEYSYQLENNEVIETKAGKYDAHKLVRKKDNDKKTTYYSWYAEKLNYLPVKLDKYENGKLDISIRITEVKWLDSTSIN